MKRVSAGLFCCAAVLLCLGVQGQGQQPAKDPRVGLKAGFRDAGQAAKNLELVASLPKPEGFFDPKAPIGEPTAPEAATESSGTTTTPASSTRSSTALNFANSDLAFGGSLVFVGNFNGFNTYDIETPQKAQLLASVVCPGGQGDASGHGNLW